MWALPLTLAALGAVLAYELLFKKHGPDFVVQLEAGKQKELGGIKSGQVILVRGPLTPGGATDINWTKPNIGFAPDGTEWALQTGPGDPAHEVQFKYIKGDGIMEVGSSNGTLVMSQNDIAAIEIQIGAPVTTKKPGVNVPPAKKVIPAKKK